jgi:hypothetical protein
VNCGGENLFMSTVPPGGTFSLNPSAYGALIKVAFDGAFVRTFDQLDANGTCNTYDFNFSECQCGGSTGTTNAVSYAWSTGATSSAINVNQTGNYTVTVTDCAGCTATDVVSVSLNSGPQLDPYTSVNGAGFVQGPNVTVCEGSSVLLDLGGNFGTDWSFTYTRPDGATFNGGANGSSNDQVFLPGHAVIDGNVNEGTWTANYTDPNGCSGSTTFTVNITSATITPFVRSNGGGFVAGNTVTICEGGSFDLGTQAGLQNNVVLTLPSITT